MRNFNEVVTTVVTISSFMTNPRWWTGQLNWKSTHEWLDPGQTAFPCYLREGPWVWVEGSLVMAMSLFAACGEGSVESARTLLVQGADVDETDCEGRTALFAAVESGNPQVVRLLLSHGAQANATDHMRRTALFSIGRAMQRLRAVEPLMPNRRVIGNVIEIVKLLLEWGASLGTTNNEGENVLLFLLSFFRSSRVGLDEEVVILTGICEFLVLSSRESGLINGRSYAGYTALHLVLLLVADVLSQELRTEEAEVTLKFQSANCLGNLLGTILSVPWCSRSLAASRVNENGNMPLHLWAALPYPRELTTEDDNASLYAMEFDFERILEGMARNLFSHGAQVNTANGIGATPLHLARTWHAAKLLLNKGALPNCTDLHGNTPLLCCVKRGVANLGQESTFMEEQCSFVYDSSTSECQMRWKEIFNLGMDPWKANAEGATVLKLLLGGYSFHVIEAFFKATTTQSCRKPDGNGDFPLHVICGDSSRSYSWKANLINDLVNSAQCNVHDVNGVGETALHVLCKEGKVDSISFEIIRCLRSYGARVESPDGSGQTCYDATAERPELRAILQEEVALAESKQSLDQWLSKSEKHKSLLFRVVRGQNSQRVGSFHFHMDPVGSGAFGHVYAGVDATDGREVAVKRFEKLRMCRPEDRREIKNLLKVSDCENVVRYLTCQEDQHFVYIILELMDGNLKTLLEERIAETEEELISLCLDVGNGLDFLHENGIIHRDIKPSNILYNTKPKLHAKLADFGLSMYVTADAGSGGQTTVMHSSAGTQCWMAPELLKGTSKHSKASDMFACGLVLHYILSGRKHPFHPKEVANKSDWEVQNQTTANILSSTLNIDRAICLEAQDIVMSLVSDKDYRPSASACLQHPLFWTRYKKIQFLCSVANQAEFERPRHLHVARQSTVEQDLERTFVGQFVMNPWDGRIEELYDEVTSPSKKSRNYVTVSAVDLVRFVRNTTTHCSELPTPMQKSVLEEFVFLTEFPTLFMHVYRSVCRGGWNKRASIAVVIEEG